jgi:hypothetical protein
MKAFVIAAAVFLPSGFVAADAFMPWQKVLEVADVDRDSRLSPEEILKFEQRDHFMGFQPFMADHFSKYDFNEDGFLSLEECRKGMQEAGYSDAQVTAEFKRDHGFRPWNREP